ncbi:MAG: amidohydrolase [Acidimicrobiia bacterium]|nr:amidohydrolase [Acidimicrobiia bacterium]MYE71839.1 amidohydrolase [Acidimicrobiia bacterium]MYJ63480.1 amidohydrolase [Acidimicrobiia bacterium]
MTTTIEDIKIIDTDTHVTEPPDLWTSRLPRKWASICPRVELNQSSGLECWRVGDEWLNPVAYYSVAGWPEYPPSHPPTLAEADSGAWDPAERLRRMDEYGIYAQVLYPNIIGFDTQVFMTQTDSDFSLACVRAYNDFLTDFASEDPNRLVPIAMLPFWDLEASVAEIVRCADLGHRGVLFANQYENAGLPPFVDPHWDPVLHTASEYQMSINFHASFSSKSSMAPSALAKLTLETKQSIARDPSNRDARAEYARLGAMSVISNHNAILRLLTSGLCDRFPTLPFVSVESGFGYVPYLLEAIDWHWVNFGARDAFSERLLPSEYFRRQAYGTFWFERGTLALLPDYADNFMFETDYPHPTSISPGPASVVDIPRRHAASLLEGLPDDVVKKVLHDNAARLYRLDD